jgi:DNA-binding MarR family transcriptional regulator/ribosomal protein S18 acetylase RimI-like enzyme
LAVDPVPGALVTGTLATRDPAVAAVRRFNRFYTRHVGALDDGHLHLSFSLAEARVLYELAHRELPTATELGRDLRLDAGYLSRMLARLEQRGLIARESAPNDSRRSHLRLTPGGRDAFAELDARAHDDVAASLTALAPADRQRLLGAMATIERLLAPRRSPAESSGTFVVRAPRPGDMGWVIARHGALYAEEYGWDASFEALVLDIVGAFVRDHDPARERAWIAEREGENVGCIFLVRHPERDGVAKLRLLLVEPSARGLGVGAHLVDECLTFAERAGYHTISLWTQDTLTAARRIYQAAGFTLVHQAPHHSFGADLIEQVWELQL